MKGEFKQKDIVASSIGDPSYNAYNIKYKYTRLKSTSNTFKTTISALPNLEKIYIDDLSKNPIITDISYSVVISSIGKTMTIPSVKAMKIKVERKYENINSKYKIIPQCYKKADHFINLASNSLSIFNNTEEKKILENLTSFSIERSF